MKKTFIVSCMSFLFLMVSSVVAYFLKFVNFGDALNPLFIGVGILICSGLIAIFAKKRMFLNIICFIISGVALGFCIRAWYIYRGFDNPLYVILLVALACVAFLWIFFLLAHIPLFEKHFNAFFWLYFILSTIIYFVVMLNTKTTYVSTFGYYMIVEIAFIFALCAESKTIQQLVRSVTLSTYSVFVVAIIILAIITNGDGLDADFTGWGDSKGSSKMKSLTKQEQDFNRKDIL